MHTLIGQTVPVIKRSLGSQQSVVFHRFSHIIRPLDRRRGLAIRAALSTTSKLAAAAQVVLPPHPTLTEDLSPPDATLSESLPSSSTSSAVRLRPYQERAVEDCLTAIAQGTSRIGVSSPTGSGKTTMFTELIARLPNLPNLDYHTTSDLGPLHPPGTRVLIIVGAIELALQAASAVTRAHPHLHVEIEQGAKYKATGSADVTVATYQTLTRSEGRLDKFRPEGLKAIIVDEAHHAASPSYISLLAHFDPEVGLTREERKEAKGQASSVAVEAQESSSGLGEVVAHQRRIPIIGFSATFSRHDGLALGRVFDSIVYHRDFLEMIEEQWLCPVRFTSIKSNIDLSGVNISAATGDFLPKSLASSTNIAPVNELIVRSWLDRAADRRNTLIFCVNVQHVIDLTAAFRKAGIDARYLHGGTSMKERKQLLEDFKQGVYKVLVNCAILTEGFDLPQIDVVLLARPTRSRNLFSQMIGRGLRLSPQTGKKDCLVLDVVGTIERGVVCTPTLFGLDPGEVIEELSLEELKARAEQASERRESASYDDVQDPTKVTYVDYASPHELQNAVSKKIGGYIYRLSPNAWVDCGGDVYILGIARKGYIKVEREYQRRYAENEEEEDESEASSHASTSHLDQASESWSAIFMPQNSDGEEAVATSSRKSFAPYRRPISILPEGGTAPSLESCIRICDTYATKHVLRSSPLNYLLRRDAGWRQQRASSSQRALVAKKLGLPLDELPKRRRRSSRSKEAQEMADDPESAAISSDAIEAADSRAREGSKILSDLTKGKAADILTRLKFGFRRRWKDEMKASNRDVKARLKESGRRKKEVVKVGELHA